MKINELKTSKRILYLLPTPSMEGGMTATTQMFYNAGLFEQSNVYHFDTKFKWHKHTLIRLFESPYLKLKFIFALIKYKPDVIFVIMSPYWGFYDKISYCLIAKLFGVKSIFNSVSARFTKFYESNAFNKLLVKLFIKIPDCVVLGTPYWYSYFKQNFPNIKLSEIPNPVITEEFNTTHKLKSEKIRVVSAFRITKEKGIKELVSVIKSVNEKSDKFVFTILGDGNQLNWVRTELAKLIKEGKVELKGFLTGAEKNKAIINADAYVMLTHFDMMPISILEAMAASLPIFSTNTGGIVDMVREGENGHLYEIGEVNKVVEKLLFYENHPDKLQLMGQNSHQLVKNNYDIEIIINKQFKLAEEITGKKLSLTDRIYKYMPVFIQNIGISLYGFKWKKRRFGGMFKSEYKEYVNREKYTPVEWNKYQEEQLRSILNHAVSTVPYYKREFKSFSEKVNYIKLDELNQLPILEKNTLRVLGQTDLISSKLESNGEFYASSGSSGTPTKILFSSTMHQKWSAAFEARIRNWAGLSIKDARGMIGGRRIISEANASAPFYRYNFFEKQVYFSAYHISPISAKNYVDGMIKHNIKYMTGYAMSNYILARFIEKQNIKAPQLKAVITSSEKLTTEMRSTLERVYQCKVYDSYSGVEACGLISECEHGTLHISPDVGIIEIIKEDGTYAKPGEIGEAICTGFLNYDQPLIRYRIGDLIKLSENQTCKCGRQMPCVDEIVGRLEDVVVGTDGREMVRFHGIFINIPSIIEAQVIQHTLTDFEIKIVSNGNLSGQEIDTIKNRMKSQLGDIEIKINQVESLPRETNGKLKAVISHVKK